MATDTSRHVPVRGGELQLLGESGVDSALTQNLHVAVAGDGASESTRSPTMNGVRFTSIAANRGS